MTDVSSTTPSSGTGDTRQITEKENIQVDKNRLDQIMEQMKTDLDAGL